MLACVPPLGAGELLRATSALPGGAPATFEKIVRKRCLHVDGPGDLIVHFAEVPGEMDGGVEGTGVGLGVGKSLHLGGPPGEREEETHFTPGAGRYERELLVEALGARPNLGCMGLCLETKNIADPAIFSTVPAEAVRLAGEIHNRTVSIFPGAEGLRINADFVFVPRLRQVISRLVVAAEPLLKQRNIFFGQEWVRRVAKARELAVKDVLRSGHCGDLAA